MSLTLFAKIKFSQKLPNLQYYNLPNSVLKVRLKGIIQKIFTHGSKNSSAGPFTFLTLHSLIPLPPSFVPSSDRIILNNKFSHFIHSQSFSPGREVIKLFSC